VIINIFMSMDMAMDMDRYRGSDKFRSNFAGYQAPTKIISAGYQTPLN
jgi:hypothetical protein